jgi:hypothetical protein
MAHRHPESGWTQSHTRSLGNTCSVGMAGDANLVARCRTWKFTTNSFAVIRGRTPSGISLLCAPSVMPDDTEEAKGYEFLQS